MTTYHLYEVAPILGDGTRGATSTVRSQSPICAVAGLSGRTRHNWERAGDGGLVVVARRNGDGAEAGRYYVRQSCFDDLPPIYPLA